MNMVYANDPIWIREILRRLKTQEMCNKEVEEETCSLVFIPNRFKTQEMLNGVVCREPYTLLYVPDHFITQEMCEEVMRVRSAAFFLILDRFKTQEICIKAAGTMGIKKRQAQKAKIKDKLMPIAWHPDLVMDWCM